MNYKEVRDSLYSKGFKIESCQTGNYLDVVGFEHPNIKGEILVTFDDSDETINKVNPDGLDEFETDYENGEILNDIPIQSIDFYINKSFSFMSDNCIPTSDEEDENCIILNGEDVGLYFHQVLDIITDEYYFINFMDLYNQKVSEFHKKLERFLPVFDKYDFDFIICREAGNQETLFCNLQYIFRYHGARFDDVAFFFEVLSWKVQGIMNICSERFEFDMDCDLEVFETELKKQIEFFDKVRNVKEVYA